MRVAETVSTIDVFPTLLSRIGVEDEATLAPLQGRVLPSAAGGGEGWAVAEELSPRFTST